MSLVETAKEELKQRIAGNKATPLVAAKPVTEQTDIIGYLEKKLAEANERISQLEQIIMLYYQHSGALAEINRMIAGDDKVTENSGVTPENPGGAQPMG